MGKQAEELMNGLGDFDRELLAPSAREAPLLLTVPEACRLLRIGKTLCWELLHNESNPMPHMRMGRRVLIPRAALLAWIVASTAPEVTATQRPANPLVTRRDADRRQS